MLSLTHVVCPASGATNSHWTEAKSNPIIRFGQQSPYLLWNDPTVLKEGNIYRMWLSGGDPRVPDHIQVDIYAAQSNDGVSWNINTTPVLSPSSTLSQWDSLRVETPSVIKVGSVYHMYYAGSDKASAQAGVSFIGHATSTDGTHWTKDPANPIVKSQTSNRFQWGYGGVGEPGVVYNPTNQTFYLYYTSMAFSTADPTIGHIGILLATSKDGSKFTTYADRTGQQVPVLTKDVPGAIHGAWFGYSTPSAVLVNGSFEMFCTFVVAPAGPTSSRQVVLAHAISSDGISYTVLEDNILEAGHRDWKDQNVRAPSVINDNGQLKVWFAGDAVTPYFGAGIGLLTQ